MMYATHDAIRRDLERVARVGDDLPRVLRTSAGWELFKKALHVHHVAEDEALWPVMRPVVAGRTDAVLLLDAMHAEHAAIDARFEAVDAAIADHTRLREVLDALASAVTAHLDHEENEVLPLIDATVTESQWQRYGEVATARIGPDGPRFLPWLLDGASTETTQEVLSRLPEPLRQVFRNAWQPAYAQVDRWAAR